MIGLFFGDCGKGRFVDELCRRQNAHTVVRYNGGGQAGHNVVLEDGRHHVFSSFGAGSFVPGVKTVLAAPVVIHPGGLLREAQVLAEKGVSDPLARLEIDARCRVTSPYLQAAGRLRELRQRHGSCGIGFGETVRFSLESPEASLTYGDLFSPGPGRDRLEAQRQALCAALAAADENRGSAPDASAREWQVLHSEDLAQNWLDQIAPLLRQVPPAGRDQLASGLSRPGAVIFEGAQGLLLDEGHGFHPHTTWSRIGPAAIEEVLAELGLDAKVSHLGVLRSYLTRHGHGPFPTEDPELDRLAEPHNLSAGWQGKFRRGQPDAVLLRYALEAAGGNLEGLLLSHLDTFEKGVPLRWCEGYATPEGRLDQLEVAAHPDLAHQERRTRQLFAAKPCYAKEPLTSARGLLARLEAATRLPIVLASHGPRQGAIRELTRRRV